MADTPGYKIDYYDQNSKITFIVFNGYGSTKVSNCFGLSYLLKKGFNVVTCLQDNNQYQELSLSDFKRLIWPIVCHKETYLYGSSLGGYCAIYYAGAVNGTVIAASPRNSAHPILIQKLLSDKKNSNFIESEFKHELYLKKDLTQKNIFIIYDPIVKIDVFFINTIVKKSYPNVQLIPYEYAGHEVLFHLSKIKQLDTVISSIISKQKIHIETLDSYFTHFGKAKFYFSKKNYEKSLFHAKSSLDDTTMTLKFRSRVEKVYFSSQEKLK